MPKQSPSLTSNARLASLAKRAKRLTLSSKQHPNTLIPTDEIITLAQKVGVDFGPGNPSERIRYFIKLGILPHAVRKTPGEIGNWKLQTSPVGLPTKSSAAVGHLPYWCIQTLIKIDRLKKNGLSYPQIAEKLSFHPGGGLNPNTVHPRGVAADQEAITQKTRLIKSKPIGGLPYGARLKTGEPKKNQVPSGTWPTINLFSKTGISEKDFAKKLKQQEENIGKILENKLSPLTFARQDLAKDLALEEKSAGALLKFSKSLLITITLTGLIGAGIYSAKNYLDLSKDKQSISEDIGKSSSLIGQVLATTSEDHRFYIDADTEVSGLTTFAENITAPNVLYGAVGGTGITVSSGQTPTISLDDAAVVRSVNDLAGTLTVAGSGGTTVSASGSTITITSTSSPLTSESDTLSTVTGRGATTSTALTLNGAVTLGSTLSFSTTNSTVNISNTGSLAFKDGTNTLFSLIDQGAFATIRLSDKGSTGNPSTCTAGDIYFNGTDASVSACTATNTWEALDASGSNFVLAGDAGTNQTVSGGDTLTVAGGTNGIDTVTSATDTITINLDTTEIGTTTFGSGSTFTWTFNAGTTDPTLAFGDGSITLSTLTVDGNATFNARIIHSIASGATTDAYTLSHASATTGAAISVSGPTATGIISGTSSGFVEITSDVGSAGTSGVLVYLAPDFSAGSVTTSYGILNAATDSTTVANTNYGTYTSLTQTNAAAKVGYGDYATVSSNSTTADSLYGGYFYTSATGNAARTANFGAVAYGNTSSTTADSVYGLYGATVASGAVSSGIRSQYGLYGIATASGAVTTATSNTYGGIFNAVVTAGTATETAYGIYTTASGADTNWALYIGSGNVNLGSATITTNLTASRFVTSDASSNLATTGTSAFLTNTLSDETGSGFAVFATSPQLTTSLTTDSTTFALLNTTATTVNFAGAATTALNIGNGNTAYTAINIGSGTGGNVINLAGTGGTGADTINIGTGGTGADTINIGSSASTTSIALTTGTGSQTFTSNVATGSTTTSGFIFDATAITSGTGAYLTTDSVTTGRLVDIATTGNTWTGNGTTNGLVNIASTSTAGTGSASSILLNLSRSGANSNTAHTAYGLASSVTNTNATSGTNIAGYFTATGATTANYALYIPDQTDATGPNYGIYITGADDYAIYTNDDNISFNNGNLVWTAATSSSDIIDINATTHTGTAGVLDIDITSATNNNRGIDLSYTSTITTSSSQYGIYANFVSTANLSASNNPDYYSIYAIANKSGTDTVGLGAITNTYALFATSTNTSTGASHTRNTYGGYFSSAGGASNGSNVYGIYVTGGTSTNNYALYIPNQTGGGTTNYGVYIAGAGSYGIYSVGNVAFDGDLSFVGAQTISTTSGALTISPNSGTLTATDVTTLNCTDCIDFDDLSDSLTLDATTTITLAASNTIVLQQPTAAAGIFDVNLSSSTSNVRGADIATTFTGTADTNVAYGLYNAVASSQVLATTVGQTFFGQYNSVTKTGADTTSGTIATYGIYTAASNTGGNTAATRNTYGGFFSAAGDANGTTSAYGVYASATSAVDLNYGLYSTASGSSVSNIAGYFSGDVWIVSDGSSGFLINGGGLDRVIVAPASTTGTLINILANSTTSGTGLSISATATTTGEILDLTGTWAPTDGSTNEAIDINITHSPTTAADNFQSINLTTTDATALGNTIYGIFNTITNSGIASKTTYGSYSALTDSGANTTGTKTLIAQYGIATASGGNGGNSNTYGGYFNATGETSGTGNSYGIYSTASGGDSNYGLFISAASGPNITNINLNSYATTTVSERAILINGTINKDTVENASESFYALEFSPTINITATSGAFGTDLLFRGNNTRVLSRLSPAITDAGGQVTYISAPTLQLASSGAGTTGTFTIAAGYRSSITVKDPGVGNTLTTTDSYSFQSLSPAIETRTTVTRHYGLFVEAATITGTLTNQYGIAIQNLTAGTNDYGIYVAGADTYGLWVDSGTVRMDGLVNVGLGSTASTTAVCSSLAGATAPTSGTAYELQDCSSTPAADYMEMYSVNADVEMADIVSPSREFVKTQDGETLAKLQRSSGSYQADIIGIVSDKNKAGDFNSIGYNIKEGDNPRPIALNGRVSVKVSTVNGEIKAGDTITSSDIPGVGMRATRAGRTIGVALESFGFEKSEILNSNSETNSNDQNSNDSNIKEGKIIVFVNPSWYIGSALASNGSLSLAELGENEQQADVSVNCQLSIGNCSVDEFGVLVSNGAFDGQILTAEQIQSLITYEVEKRIGELLASSQFTVNGSQEVESPVPQSSTPGVDQDSPSHIPGANEASGSAALANQTQQTLDELDKLLATTDLSLSTLTVTGNSNLAQTQVAGTFSQDGTFIIDYGKQLNVLGSTLYLQNDPLAGCFSDPVSESSNETGSLVGCTNGTLVDIGAGAATIDKLGNLVIAGTLTAQNIETKELTVDVSNANSQTVGSAQIPANREQVTIFTTALKPNAKVLVTPTTVTGGKTIYISTKVDFEGFTVSIENGPAVNAINFDWLIVNTSLQSKL